MPLSLRRRRASKDLGIAGALVEVRGDWAFMKEVFHVPGWAEKGLCCWRCRCTADQVRETGAHAAWRNARLGHWDLMALASGKGHAWSPVFRAPWLTAAQFKMDWLHVADHGVTASFLGNLFWFILKRMPGGNEAEKLTSLWDR